MVGSFCLIVAVTIRGVKKMHQAYPNKQVKIIEPFLIFLVIGLGIIYFVNALNSGSWTWFLQRTVNVTPSRIVLVDHGERTIFQPGQAEFNMLTEAAAQSLSKLSNNDLVSIGLSEQTLEDYATNSVLLELYFDSPVVFDTVARTGEPTQLLIPIEGRHSLGGYVFRGAKGEWWFGAVRMADPHPLYSALEHLGIMAEANQPAG
jgi:hypothetical protein